MYATTAAATIAARVEQMRRQCEQGRHVVGCEHRPASPWVRSALAGTLPPKVLSR